MFEVILVIRMVIFVSRMSQNFDTNSKFLKEFDRSNDRIHDFPIIHKFPFSILIAFLGCLVGTTGCILRIIQLVSLRRNREHGSLSTDQTAPTPIGLTNLQENGQTHDGTMQTSTPWRDVDLNNFIDMYRTFRWKVLYINILIVWKTRILFWMLY